MLVAYDDAELARRVAEAVQPDVAVVSGMAELPEWAWVPEVDLPERYGRAARVVVVDGGTTIAPARVWLARANGATAWGVVAGAIEDGLDGVAVTFDAVGTIDWEVATPITAEVNAGTVAARLVDAARDRGVVLMNGKA